MQHHTSDETLAKLITQPDQVPGRVDPRCRGRLHLDGNEPVSVQLSDEIDFMLAVAIPQVVQPWLREAQLQLSAELPEHEGVEQLAEQVTVPQDSINRELQRPWCSSARSVRRGGCSRCAMIAISVPETTQDVADGTQTTIMSGSARSAGTGGANEELGLIHRASGWTSPAWPEALR